MTDVAPGCRFCQANGLLVDSPLLASEHFYMLGSIDPDLPSAGMLIPHRHSETPFEFSSVEWADFGDILLQAKTFFSHLEPDGFTLGWNVGAIAGQQVFHTHLHIIPRFKGEAAEGAGIRRLLRPQSWIRQP